MMVGSVGAFFHGDGNLVSLEGFCLIKWAVGVQTEPPSTRQLESRLNLG